MVKPCLCPEYDVGVAACWDVFKLVLETRLRRLTIKKECWRVGGATVIVTGKAVIGGTGRIATFAQHNHARNMIKTVSPVVDMQLIVNHAIPGFYFKLRSKSPRRIPCQSGFR